MRYCRGRDAYLVSSHDLNVKKVSSFEYLAHHMPISSKQPIFERKELHVQGELAEKNIELAAAAREAENLLKDISENTTIAEVEKGKVAVIVDQVSVTAAVGIFA